MSWVVALVVTPAAPGAAASRPGRRRPPPPPPARAPWGTGTQPTDLCSFCPLPAVQFGKYLVEKQRPEWAEQYVGAWVGLAGVAARRLAIRRLCCLCNCRKALASAVCRGGISSRPDFADGSCSLRWRCSALRLGCAFRASGRSEHWPAASLTASSLVLTATPRSLLPIPRPPADYKALKDLIKESAAEEAAAGGVTNFSPRTTSLTVQRAADRRDSGAHSSACPWQAFCPHQVVGSMPLHQCMGRPWSLASLAALFVCCPAAFTSRDALVLSMAILSNCS